MDDMYKYQQALQESAGASQAARQQKTYQVDLESLANSKANELRAQVEGAVAPLSVALAGRGAANLAGKYLGSQAADAVDAVASGDASQIVSKVGSALRGLGQPAASTPSAPAASASESVGSTVGETGNLSDLAGRTMYSLGGADPFSAQAVADARSSEALFNPSVPVHAPEAMTLPEPMQGAKPSDAPSLNEGENPQMPSITEEPESVVPDLPEGPLSVADLQQPATTTLETMAEVDAAGGGPEDPFADIASVAIGIGALFGSIFGIHKPSKPTVAQVAPLNPSSQFGV